jgi:hypothetical protein
MRKLNIFQVGLLIGFIIMSGIILATMSAPTAAVITTPPKQLYCDIA